MIGNLLNIQPPLESSLFLFCRSGVTLNDPSVWILKLGTASLRVSQIMHVLSLGYVICSQFQTKYQFSFEFKKKNCSAKQLAFKYYKLQLPFPMLILHSRKQEARVIGFLGLTSSIERLTHIALSMWKLIGLLDTQIILKVTKICLHVIFGNGIGWGILFWLCDY